ncbi:aminoimidazole riboside kinase [Neisseria dentiae]|uniref:PfkB family carbohydrate kinase n=1 Tax=Neisseria dentiae TaxID=194197 RepID=UPI000DFDB5E7|nr:aminoimidazole riboside kinase [Neisseria dentiae]
MKVTSFGEVLWDDFPGGKVLGGAPLNVLVRLRSLGVDTSMISSRGDDADGEELLRQIESKNVNTDLLQVCKDQATSLVKVHLDACGSASYEIVYPCAWDRIQVEEAALQRVAESDASFTAAFPPATKFPAKRSSNWWKKPNSKFSTLTCARRTTTPAALLEMMKKSRPHQAQRRRIV